jgi:hypothetical protein
VRPCKTKGIPVKMRTRKLVISYNWYSTGETFFRVPFFTAVVALLLQRTISRKWAFRTIFESAVVFCRFLKDLLSGHTESRKDINAETIGWRT